MAVAGKFSPEVLRRRWVHSHEEDTPGEIVFRPEDFHFPPSRGRRSFELKADGTLVEAGPGPVDRREHRHGVWRLEGDELVFCDASAGPPRQRLVIAAAERDRLVLRK